MIDIKNALGDLPGSVTLRYYTSDVESWYSAAERRLLERIAEASPQIRLDVHADRWDARREADVGIARTPAIAVTAGERDTGIRYYGLPDGYELEIFLGVLRAASGHPPPLSAQSKARLRALLRPVHLQVIVSPT